jgi:phosphoenolpyruvate carboxylase
MTQENYNPDGTFKPIIGPTGRKVPVKSKEQLELESKIAELEQRFNAARTSLKSVHENSVKALTRRVCEAVGEMSRHTTRLKEEVGQKKISARKKAQETYKKRLCEAQSELDHELNNIESSAQAFKEALDKEKAERCLPLEQELNDSKSSLQALLAKSLADLDSQQEDTLAPLIEKLKAFQQEKHSDVSDKS